MKNPSQHKTFTEKVEVKNVSDDYFCRMLSREALKRSKPYNDEENFALSSCTQAIPGMHEMNFVVIGAGELWYLKHALDHAKNYVAVEPLVDAFVSEPIKCLIERQEKDIFLLAQCFSTLSRSVIPEGATFWMFFFNIMAYIENPIETINGKLAEGDVIFMSTWSSSPESKAVRKDYFDFLNKHEGATIVDPENSVGLCHFDDFPFDELKFYKRHERIKGTITDILIIYT